MPPMVSAPHGAPRKQELKTTGRHGDAKTMAARATAIGICRSRRFWCTTAIAALSGAGQFDGSSSGRNQTYDTRVSLKSIASRI